MNPSWGGKNWEKNCFLISNGGDTLKNYVINYKLRSSKSYIFWLCEFLNDIKFDLVVSLLVTQLDNTSVTQARYNTKEK